MFDYLLDRLIQSKRRIFLLDCLNVKSESEVLSFVKGVRQVLEGHLSLDRYRETLADFCKAVMGIEERMRVWRKFYECNRKFSSESHATDFFKGLRQEFEGYLDYNMKSERTIAEKARLSAEIEELKAQIAAMPDITNSQK